MEFAKIFRNCVVICLLLVVMFSLCPTLASAHPLEGDGTVVIHVDENGFEPDVATIPLGTKVVFENVGNEDHWPASDNHPSHTLYDNTSLKEHCGDDYVKTFDSCDPVSVGESWDFVFGLNGQKCW